MSNWADNEEIKILQEYLRIPSVQPNVDYEPCVAFLKKQAENLSLEFNVCYPAKPDKPVVIMSWFGSKPELPSIILNSHMDVVPVFEERWTHKPFNADIDENGNIFARGIQDTKGLGIMYLSAIRSLKKKNIKLNRTFHVLFVPDEEIGGEDGMKAFVETEDFRNLKAGFAWDEAGPFPTEKMLFVFYGERAKWAPIFKITAEAGHGSMMPKDTAAEKLLKLMNKFYEFRDTQIKILEEKPFNFAESTAINATIINGGVQQNVIPAEFTLAVDIRIPNVVDHDEFENMFKLWCEEIGGITYHFEQKDPCFESTTLDDSNIYWIAMNKAIEEMGLKSFPASLPATTDARFIRNKKIPAIGLLPVNELPILAHAHDEYMPAAKFLEGIEITKKIIENLGNC